MGIKELIEDYKAFDEQEEKDKEIILKYINIFDDVLTRNNEFAHFTSSAFVVNKDRNKILMVHHNIYNSWIIPGGHADGEIDMLGVALREVQEETAIKNIRPITTEIFLIDTLPVVGHFKRGKYVSAHTDLNVTYLLEVDENELLEIKADENSGVQWIPIEKIFEKSTLPYMKRVYEKAIKKLELFKV